MTTDPINEAEGFEQAAARTFLEHNRRLDGNHRVLSAHEGRIEQQAETLGHHDKRLTKLAGRVDNANRVITETRGELNAARSALADNVAAVEHMGDHIAHAEQVADRIIGVTERLALAANAEHARVTSILDRLGAHDTEAQMRETNELVQRTRFANTNELAETVYARLRMADAWLMQSDAHPEMVAQHHANIASVLATMYAAITAAEPIVETREEPAPSTFSDTELAGVFVVHRTRHAKSTHRKFAECTLAPCVEVDQVSREAYAQRVSRRAGGVYVGQPAGSAFATAAADAMRDIGAGNITAAAMAEVTSAFERHTEFAHLKNDFADCEVEPCASVTRAMRYIYANSTDGVTAASRRHFLTDHTAAFADCEVEPCRSIDKSNRASYDARSTHGKGEAPTPSRHVQRLRDASGIDLKAGDEATVEMDSMPARTLHVAADGLTIHQGRTADCSVPACTALAAPAGVDDSMSDLAAAIGKSGDTERAWTAHGDDANHVLMFELCDVEPCVGINRADRAAHADRRGEPNDPNREG